jgi:Domain of unknown function (DUF4124)
MHLHPNVLFLLLAPCVFGAAHAGIVYKCTNPQGVITFQDQPCRVGDSETVIHLTTPPPAPATVASSEATATESQPPPAPAAAIPRVQQTLPPLWLCTRPEDGTHFVSHDGATTPRMVPAGILGIPNKPLTSAYGPGGIGVSAPGVRRIPVDTSPQMAVAGAYVAVQDQCERASPEQTCDYLREQSDKVHTKLRRAFKDEQAELQPQADELDKQIRGC